jgi:hypothetical protein
LPRGSNVTMSASNSLTTFTDAIMQSLTSEPSPHLLEAEAFLRDPLLLHHYDMYDDWETNVIVRESAGVRMAEIAAQLQVSPFCCQIRYLIS